MNEEFAVHSTIGEEIKMLELTTLGNYSTESLMLCSSVISNANYFIKLSFSFLGVSEYLRCK